MKHSLRTFLLVIFVTLLAACGPSEEDQLATVEVLVAETVAAIPTQAPQATLPPLPTFTPQATFTAVPSQTPQPTYTPLPTYTPFPTTSPTATETPLPTVAPTTNAAIAPTTAPVANVQNQLLATIENVLLKIDIFRSSIRRFSAGNPPELLPSDCPAIVASFDSISNILSVETSAQDSVVQNAYAIYRAATDTTLSLMSPYAERCRTAIAEGESIMVIDSNQFNILHPAFDEPISQLNQAATSLREP